MPGRDEERDVRRSEPQAVERRVAGQTQDRSEVVRRGAVDGEGPLADMYREGFWPPDKSRLPKSLSDALYNRNTQSSFFVLACYDPPNRCRVQEKEKQREQWRGGEERERGKTEERAGKYAEKLSDPRWQKKRLKVFERDGWRCGGCGAEDRPLYCCRLTSVGGDPWDVPDGDLTTRCEECFKKEGGERREERKQQRLEEMKKGELKRLVERELRLHPKIE